MNASDPNLSELIRGIVREELARVGFAETPAGYPVRSRMTNLQVLDALFSLAQELARNLVGRAPSVTIADCHGASDLFKAVEYAEIRSRRQADQSSSNKASVPAN